MESEQKPFKIKPFTIISWVAITFFYLCIANYFGKIVSGINSPSGQTVIETLTRISIFGLWVIVEVSIAVIFWVSVIWAKKNNDNFEIPENNIIIIQEKKTNQAP